MLSNRNDIKASQFILKIAPTPNPPTLHSTHLRLPIGGVAYGTPRNASTGGLVRAIMPRNGPYFVFTVFRLYLMLAPLPLPVPPVPPVLLLLLYEEEAVTEAVSTSTARQTSGTHAGGMQSNRLWWWL